MRRKGNFEFPMGFQSRFRLFSEGFFRQTFFDEENFVCLGKLSFYDQHQEKVSGSDLYAMHLTFVLLTRLQSHSHLPGQYSRQYSW